eukprot:GHVH01001597.1.p1 GENE.GHVH01001597.1~~GHVH01001597.1.p1  ORF type:complete len:340 (+),score=46.14 GHVH01001597.1:454-1473(+)
MAPVDGLLMNYFRLGDDLRSERVSQVKGASYHVASLIGEDLPKPKNGRCYMVTVLYLSPGDYHHFHAPCDVSFTHRKHFHGEVYPVAPPLAKSLENLFALNERVCISGTWKHGLLHYVPVAAYNVGDIRICFDSELKTNSNHRISRILSPKKDDASVREPKMSDGFVVNRFGSLVEEKYYYQTCGPIMVDEPKVVIHLDSDEEDDQSHLTQCSTSSLCDEFVFDDGAFHMKTMGRIGEFKLGSTVVMVVETKDDFVFTHPFKSRVKMGQLLGYSRSEKLLEEMVVEKYESVYIPNPSPEYPKKVQLLDKSISTGSEDSSEKFAFNKIEILESSTNNSNG